MIKQQYYNKGSLDALDTLVAVQEEIPFLESGFSHLYHQVIQDLQYVFSQHDQDILNQEQQELATFTGSILQEYQNCGLDDNPNPYATVLYVMQRIKEVTGKDYAHLDTAAYPTLAKLCTLISSYAQKATNTLHMQNEWIEATDRLNAISQNITNPTDQNGGLRIDANTCVIGWDHLMDSKDLLSSLEKDNSVTVSLSVNKISAESSDLHFDTSAVFKVPFNWLFRLTVNHEHSYDLSTFADDTSSLSVTITYGGLTVMAADPLDFSVNGAKGWFDRTVLQNAAQNAGKDATGYQLSSQRFEPSKLFGKEGQLRRLKTFVLSRQPEIKLSFQHFNSQALNELFTQSTDVTFQLFGGLLKGDHDNDYTFSDYHYDAASQTVEVSIVPPPITGGGASTAQTAFILGGVPEYYEG